MKEAEAMKNINKDIKSDEHIIKYIFSLYKGFFRGVIDLKSQR